MKIRTLTLIFVMMLSSMSLFAQNDVTDQVTKLYNEGIELHDQGKYDAAVKKYNQALKLDPTNGALYYEKALTLQTQGNVKDAKKLLETGFKKCEGTGEDLTLNYVAYANIIDDEGDTKRAIEILLSAAEKSHDDDPDYQQRLVYNLGVCYQRRMTQVPDSISDYAIAAENCFTHSLVLNPQHAGSYYGLYSTMTSPEVRSIDWSQYSSALGFLGWYGFFGANHPRIDQLAEMPDKFLGFNLSQEEVDSLGPCSRAVYLSVCETAKKEPSEYGRVYDIFMNAIPNIIAADDSLKELVPLGMIDGDPHDQFLYPLYDKMLKDSVFETFCHVVAMRVKKDYIANANWLTKNEAAKQKLIDFLNAGRYFDPEVRQEQMYGLVPSVDSVATAEDAHARNEEAKLACVYYLSHYLGSDEMQKTANFLLSWTQASPDVSIPIGDGESKWMNENSGPYLIAYMAACSVWALENNTKDLTPDGYVEAMAHMLIFYDANKDKTGTNEELDLLFNLMNTDGELFEAEVKKRFPATTPVNSETEK